MKIYAFNNNGDIKNWMTLGHSDYDITFR